MPTVAVDHPVVLNGIRAVIARQDDMSAIAEAADGVAAVELYREHGPDVVLMDVHMPCLDGVGAIRAIVRMDAAARVIALSGYARDAEICRVLEAGACGYLVKEMVTTDVVEAIRAAAAGKRVIPPDVAARLAEFTPRVDLTAREVEVLRLAARGLHNRAIAWAIGRSEETVKGAGEAHPREARGRGSHRGRDARAPPRDHRPRGLAGC
jgi:two-component system, NarL family, response regulator